MGPGICYRIAHEPREYSLAAGIASEEHGVELDEIHDVAYIDIAERSAQRVGRIFGDTSVHREMAIVLGDSKPVDLCNAFMPSHRSRMHLPYRVADDELGRSNPQSKVTLSQTVPIEQCRCIHSALLARAVIVVPGKKRMQAVFGILHAEVEGCGTGGHFPLGVKRTFDGVWSVVELQLGVGERLFPIADLRHFELGSQARFQPVESGCGGECAHEDALLGNAQVNAGKFTHQQRIHKGESEIYTVFKLSCSLKLYVFGIK